MAEFATSELLQQRRYLTALFRRRKWTLLTFLAVTIFVVLVGTALQTPLFRATAVVLIDMETPSVLTVSATRDDTQMGQASWFSYADYYRTQMEVIKSRRVAKRVFDRLNLSGKLSYARAKDPVAALLDQLKVEPVKQTRLAKVHVELSDPQLAAQIANEFASVFVEENLVKSASTEALTLMKNEYVKLQSREAELSKRYKPQHPSMVRVRQQMEQLARTIGQELSDQQEREKQLRETPSATPVGGDSQTLFKRLREDSLVSGLRPNNIRVQDFAQAPVKRFKPSVFMNLLFGLMLGVLGGFAAAVVEELLDSTVKVPADIEEDGRTALLGFVPRIDLNGTSGDNGALDAKQRYQHMHFGTDSQAAEAFLVIRTNLIYAAPQGESRSVVVTSPGMGEGKTTTVTNLGIALAQVGLNVLVVDADMRKPRIHAAFDLERAPGLSEFLVGRARFDEIVRATDIPGLSVVTSGARPPNPTELLSLRQMRDFLNQASARFDRVVLDTPPVIPVTDAVILAALTGMVLVVAQSGKTPREALRRLTRLCSDVHAKVAGVVLNNVPRMDVPAYGYGQSVYAYGSKPDQDQEREAAGTTAGRLAATVKRLVAGRLHIRRGEEEKLSRASTHAGGGGR